MQTLWLDYQRPYPGRRRFGWLLLALSLVATGVLLAGYFTSVAERDELLGQVLRLRGAASRGQLLEAAARLSAGAHSSTPQSPSQQSSTPQSPSQQSSIPQSPNPRGRGEVAAVAHPAAQWESLFASLESAGDESVTLLGLQPGASEIIINGEAKNLAASMDYLNRLQFAKVLVNAHLTQSEIVLEHPQRPVRFTLAAEWGGG